MARYNNVMHVTLSKCSSTHTKLADFSDSKKINSCISLDIKFDGSTTPSISFFP